MLVIDDSSFNLANTAMACVLLLYYHLLDDGGIGHDQTIYINHKDFHGFNFLETKVCEPYQMEINQQLLQEGAVVYLLCDLNDILSYYPDDFLSQEYTQQIIKKYLEGKMKAIKETDQLFSLFHTLEVDFNYDIYHEILGQIYTKYVVGKFISMINST